MFFGVDMTATERNFERIATLEDAYGWHRVGLLVAEKWPADDATL
jgi:hypothetical protein